MYLTKFHFYKVYEKTDSLTMCTQGVNLVLRTSARFKQGSLQSYKITFDTDKIVKGIGVAFYDLQLVKILTVALVFSTQAGLHLCIEYGDIQ